MRTAHPDIRLLCCPFRTVLPGSVIGGVSLLALMIARVTTGRAQD